MESLQLFLTSLGFSPSLSSISSGWASLQPCKADCSRDTSRGSGHERAWGEPPGSWRLLKAQAWSSAASLQKAKHHSSSFEGKLGYNILTDQSSSLKLVIINKLDRLWDGCHFVFTELKEDCSNIFLCLCTYCPFSYFLSQCKIKFCYKVCYNFSVIWEDNHSYSFEVTSNSCYWQLSVSLVKKVATILPQIVSLWHTA